jgi:hypothetical protein
MTMIDPMIKQVIERGARHNLLKEILEDMIVAQQREDIQTSNGHLPFKAEPVVHVECTLTDNTVLVDENFLREAMLEPMLNALAGQLEKKGLGPLYLWHGKLSSAHRLDPSYYIAVRTTRKKT